MDHEDLATVTNNQSGIQVYVQQRASCHLNVTTLRTDHFPFSSFSSLPHTHPYIQSFYLLFLFFLFHSYSHSHHPAYSLHALHPLQSTTVCPSHHLLLLHPLESRTRTRTRIRFVPLHPRNPLHELGCSQPSLPPRNFPVLDHRYLAACFSPALTRVNHIPKDLWIWINDILHLPLKRLSCSTPSLRVSRPYSRRCILYPDLLS